MQARHQVAPLVAAILAGNAANVALNWWFVTHEGWGPVGSGWASSISRWVMLATLVGIAWRDIRPRLRPWMPESLTLRPMLRLLGIGIPIAIQYELEVNAFAVVAVMMGWIGATAMAGHQISINIAAMTFMVPLGVSAAAAVRVGRAVGANDPLAVRRAAVAALAIGAGFMTLTATVMLVAPFPLARAYTPDAAVLATAVMLLPLAGLFQVFDGIQVVAVGILRGTGDTRAPMIINVLGFWLLGVPVSWYLGIHTSLGPRGLWWGFVAGLAAVAMLLLARVRYRLRTHISRTVVEERAVPAT
jgi:MATE family multidrug resistance protein